MKHIDNKNDIEGMLIRFMAGESTLDEEAELTRYFSTHTVDEEFVPYQRMFAYFENGMTEKPMATTTRHNLFRWLGGVAAAAAVILLVVGAWHTLRQPPAERPAPLQAQQQELPAKAPARSTETTIEAAKAAPQLPKPMMTKRTAATPPPARSVKRNHRVTNADSIEIERTQAELEVAESEMIADRLLLDLELQRALPAQSGWVTTSLNIQ